MPGPVLPTRLLFVLIHNGSEERLRVIRPKLRALVEQFDAQLHETHWQPDLGTSRAGALRWFVRSRSAERAHRRHLRFRGNARPDPTILDSIRELLRSALRRRTEGRRPRGALIEQVLTEKHARAWGMFLDAEADVLIALEDDAVIPADAAERIATLLSDARIDVGQPMYIDLAGGFPLRKIARPTAIQRLDGGLVRTKVPFGNTTCGYALSRPLAAEMLSELTWDPLLRELGPDWLVNELMMRIHPRVPIDCIHAEPTIFGHGSFLGTYASEIQARPAPKAPVTGL